MKKFTGLLVALVIALVLTTGAIASTSPPGGTNVAVGISNLSTLPGATTAVITAYLNPAAVDHGLSAVAVNTKNNTAGSAAGITATTASPAQTVLNAASAATLLDNPTKNTGINSNAMNLRPDAQTSLSTRLDDHATGS